MTPSAATSEPDRATGRGPHAAATTGTRTQRRPRDLRGDASAPLRRRATATLAVIAATLALGGVLAPLWEPAAHAADGAVAPPDEPHPEPAATLPESRDAFPAGSRYAQLGDYEWRVVRPILTERGYTPELAPEGLTICAIHYAPRPIFLPEEPFPLWLNALHVTTRANTVAWAAPVETGQRYTELVANDVELELQNPAVFSMVAALPVESSTAGCVELLVVTRDLWSLRLAFAPQLSGGVLEYLGVSIEETNFLGLNDTIGVDFGLRQGSWELGPRWFADWLGGRDVVVSEEFRVIVNREEGGYEGTANRFELRRPLRSSRQERGWHVVAEHRASVGRVFDGRAINRVTIDDPETGRSWELDERWDDLIVNVEGGYTRSYGLQVKHNVTVGPYATIRGVGARVADPDVPQAVIDELIAERLPRAERSIGLRTSYEFFYNRFFALTNYRDFERAERYRLGLSGFVTVDYSEPGLGATARFLEARGAVSHVQPLGADALVQIAGLSAARLRAPVTDVRFEGLVLVATPRAWAGRWVARAWAQTISRNDANLRTRLNATTGLRGVLGTAVEGSDAWLANVEWRSLPVDVLSVYVGLAAFADIGGAREVDEDWTSLASVGVGLRVFVPQGMATVGSIDLAMPVGNGQWSGRPPSPVLTVRFGQLFDGLLRTDGASLLQ